MSGTISLFFPTLKSILFTLNVPLKVILFPDSENVAGIVTVFETPLIFKFPVRVNFILRCWD